MKVRPGGWYGVEIRNANLDGGRLDISLGVRRGKTRGASAKDNEREARRRETAVHLAVERGEWQILRDLRAGKISMGQLVDAGGDFSDLRRVDAGVLTLGDAAARVLEEKTATREPATVYQYEHVIRSLLDEWGEDRALATISGDDARAWLYRERNGAPWAANTQAVAVMVAGYVWRSAIRAELEAAERAGARPRLTRSIWDNVDPRGQRIRRHAFLEPDQWLELARVTEGLPVHALLGVMCLAGLRIREALYLRVRADLDMDAGLIRVQPRDGDHNWKPKTDNSVRDVPIVPELVPMLEFHLKRFAGAVYVFRAARSDRPLSHETAKGWVRDAYQAAGIKYGRSGDGLTAHSLRHSFASWLVREGWSAALVAKLMGNTSREVERTYAHLRQEDLVRVMGTIDTLVAR